MTGAWLNAPSPPVSQLTGPMLAKLLGRGGCQAGLTKGSKGVSQIRLVDEAVPVLIHDGECLEAQEQGREHRGRENCQPLQGL